MNIGICVCVLLAALSSGSLSLPSQSTSQRAEGEALVSDSLPSPSSDHTRQARSAPALPSEQLTNYNQPQWDADARNSLSQWPELMARLMSSKGEPLDVQAGCCQEIAMKTKWNEMFPFHHLMSLHVHQSSCFILPLVVLFHPSVICCHPCCA
uniref:Cholecystokinin-like n=1 Tax=Mastacembelus armatus TaxID=205130 RepID=A0A3Q3NGQ9_9TELE